MSADKSPLTQSRRACHAGISSCSPSTRSDGFGGMGEGMSIAIAKDGRRIIWLAHESAPKNFTGVDVSDPRNPKVVVQTDLPQSHMRSNSLECSGNIMAVAYQTQKKGLKPAGFELFDVSVPENPKSISFFDCSGDTSRGVHQLWFCDGEYVHIAAGAPTSRPRIPTTTSSTAASTCAIRPSRGKSAAGGCPARGSGDNVAPPPRHTLDKGYRAHNCNVYKQRPDRLYLCYLDGGMYVMDISDKSQPKVISHWTNSPPYTGFTHTAVPLFDRGLILVTEELTENNAKDWPKLVWLLDARDEAHPVSFATLPMPPVDAYKDRGGRFGAHNIHENPPLPTVVSVRPDRVRHLLQRRHARLRHLQRLSAEGSRRLRAAGAGRIAGGRGAAQRRVRRRAPNRLHGRSPDRRVVYSGDGFLGRFPSPRLRGENGEQRSCEPGEGQFWRSKSW